MVTVTTKGGMGYPGTEGGPWLRLMDVIYVWAPVRPEAVEWDDGIPHRAERWVVEKEPDMTAPIHVARALDDLWQEYELWAEADARMGDPNP